MTAPKRRGRPPFIWLTKPGKAFAAAVSEVKHKRYPIKTTAAIIAVLTQPEFKYLKQQYPLRYLEKKYQEILNSNPMSRLLKECRKRFIGTNN
jgi:hypothetical protein